MLALASWQVKTAVYEVKPSGNGKNANLEIKLVASASKRAVANKDHREQQPAHHHRKTETRENNQRERQILARKATRGHIRVNRSSRPDDNSKSLSASKPERYVPPLTFTARNYESLTNLRIGTSTKPNDNETTAIQRNGVGKGSEQDANRLTAHLNQMFSQYFHYPSLARRNGWQGMVKLGLRIESDGQLSHIRILKTSGFRILDQAALDSINKIAVLPGAREWLRGAHFDTVLPVRYKLLDS
jgi:TonB family protein